MNDQEFAERQEAIYLEMGEHLLTLAADHQGSWQEVLFSVERVTVPEAERAGVHFSFRTTLVLTDGMSLPLVARPALIAATEKLDELCRRRTPEVWSGFEFRLHRDDDDEPAFECHFSYPATMH